MTVETEAGLSLKISPKLVVLSGSDGVGQDTILEAAHLDPEKISVVDLAPTKGINPDQEVVAQKLKPGHDLTFAIGYAIGWSQVKKDLSLGKIVIAKKPLHFLTHTLTREDPLSRRVQYLERWVERGKATQGLWPTVWIEVEASENDIVANLKSRELAGKLTSYDPSPDKIDKVRARIDAEKTMLQFVERVSDQLGGRVVRLQNQRIEDPDSRSAAIQVLAGKLNQEIPA